MFATDEQRRRMAKTKKFDENDPIYIGYIKCVRCKGTGLKFDGSLESPNWYGELCDDCEGYGCLPFFVGIRNIPNG